MADPLMSQPNVGGGAGRSFSLAYGLWIAAAALVVAGFVLRILASLLSVPHLRFGGVAVIAVGLGVAVLGWVSERLAER